MSFSTLSRRASMISRRWASLSSPRTPTSRIRFSIMSSGTATRAKKATRDSSGQTS